MEQLSILRAFLISEPSSLAPVAAAVPPAPDPLLQRRLALLEQQLEHEKEDHAKALFAASDKDHGQRVELEQLRLANAVLTKQAEEIPVMRLRLAEANDDARKRVDRTEATVPPPSAAVDALLQALKKSCTGSEQLLSDCCSQLRALQGDTEAARAEVTALRSACATSNAASAQLVLTNAALRQRLSATLECQSAMATRASQQGAALAAAEARIVEAAATLGLQGAQVGDLTKKLAAAGESAASHSSSLLLLHESRVTQEGALSRLRTESVALRERIRVHGDEASSAAAKHAADLREKAAHASELSDSLRDAREGSGALARALRTSAAKVEALELQLSEAELARSKLVAQLCDAEQRVGSHPQAAGAVLPSSAPLAQLSAAALTQAMPVGLPARPEPEMLQDGDGDPPSAQAVPPDGVAGGKPVQLQMPPQPVQEVGAGCAASENDRGSSLLCLPAAGEAVHLQDSGAGTGGQAPVASVAAAQAIPLVVPGSEEALACDALASLLGAV